MPLPEVTWTPEFNETHTYYDQEDHESLEYESLFDYLECLICDAGLDVDSALKQNRAIDVVGYDRMKLDRKCCEFLDNVLDNLYEADGICDPDGDGPDLPNDTMQVLRNLETRFIDELEKMFIPWGCLPVVKIKVPFRDWWESLDDKDRELLRG